MIIKLLNKEFKMECDIIDVTLSLVPDKNWEFTDKAGHLHRWQNGKLPSLKEIIDCPATDEYPTESHLVCKRCGETIRLSYTSGDREFLPGLSHYYINNTKVTKDEFEKQYQRAFSKVSFD